MSKERRQKREFVLGAVFIIIVLFFVAGRLYEEVHGSVSWFPHITGGKNEHE